MNLMTTKPALTRIRTDMDRMIDRMFGGPFFAEVAPSRIVAPAAEWEPRLDLSETDAEYLVRLEVPGAYRENLDVAVEGDLLTLSGKREFRKEGKGEHYLWEELEEGQFTRLLRLPGQVVADKVEANYADGILTVHLPKLAPSAKSRIAIK